MTKKLALAALAAALMSTTAFAQSSPPAGSTAPAVKPMDPVAIQSTAQGKWRASKLIGLNVYNANNEKIGDINELVTDSSGKIDIAVIGVGGFVGIGEHNVGVPFSQLKFVDEPVRSSSTTATGTRTTGSGAPAATTTTTTTSSAAKDYPDHAMLNMTKDQLKAMPAFKYASDTSTTRTTTTAPAPANRAPAAPAAR